MKSHLEGLMTSQREADQALKRWATQCGWLPSVQPEAAAEKSEEIEALKREIAGLRQQLDALSTRLDEQQK